MSILELKLISPNKEYFNGEVEMVVIPGEEGDFSALKEHAPLVTYLRPGKIQIYQKEKLELEFFAGSGFVKIINNNCLILVDYIKNIKEIDKKKTEKQIHDINQRIKLEVNNTLLDKLLVKKRILEEEYLIS